MKVNHGLSQMKRATTKGPSMSLTNNFNIKFTGQNYQYRHSSISAVSISAIFDLTRFIILSYFPPL